MTTAAALTRDVHTAPGTGASSPRIGASTRHCGLTSVATPSATPASTHRLAPPRATATATTTSAAATPSVITAAV